MKLFISDSKYIDTTQGYDISRPIVDDGTNMTAWYLDQPSFEPVKAEGFVGLVSEGGAVNFRTITFNPHGHCTHTETYGHIYKDIIPVNNVLKDNFILAQVISIQPENSLNEDGQMDYIITAKCLSKFAISKNTKALVIRTLPQSTSELTRNYSHTNPPFMSTDCLEILDHYGIEHLLIDTPSVDRESDGGVLAFHHAYWNMDGNIHHHRTITELIHVSEEIADGIYLMNLQIANFVNDASPSRPILYRIKDVK